MDAGAPYSPFPIHHLALHCTHFHSQKEALTVSQYDTMTLTRSFNRDQVVSHQVTTCHKCVMSQIQCKHCCQCFFMFLPGRLVPRATKVMATTLSANPMVQPKCEATSPMTIVNTPIITIEATKQAHPPQMSVGGTIANNSFQKTVRQCIMQSPYVGVVGSSLSSSSPLPLTVRASVNCSFQEDVPTTRARLALTSNLSTVFLNSLLSNMVTSAFGTSPEINTEVKRFIYSIDTKLCGFYQATN